MVFFFFQAEDGIRDDLVTGVQTCALPILFLLQTIPITTPKFASLNSAHRYNCNYMCIFVSVPQSKYGEILYALTGFLTHLGLTS